MTLFNSWIGKWVLSLQQARRPAHKRYGLRLQDEACESVQITTSAEVDERGAADGCTVFCRVTSRVGAQTERLRIWQWKDRKCISMLLRYFTIHARITPLNFPLRFPRISGFRHGAMLNLSAAPEEQGSMKTVLRWGFGRTQAWTSCFVLRLSTILWRRRFGRTCLMDISYRECDHVIWENQ